MYKDIMPKLLKREHLIIFLKNPKKKEQSYF